ncbi:MAG: ParB/RepB/Spo0J family partition protein [Burkholderiales bacterium]
MPKVKHPLNILPASAETHTQDTPPAAEPPATYTTTLRPAQIAPSRTNPRKTFNAAALAELAASLQQNGQVQAALVRPLPASRLQDTFEDRQPGDPLPEYELVVGERRWRAARSVGMPLRVEVRALTDLEVLRIQIIENLHREDVHPMEEAEGYDQLLHHSAEGISIEQLAAEIGKSRAYVYARMKLTALCKEARDAFYGGAFDASVALLIARLGHADLQVKAVEDIAKQAKALGMPASYRSIRDMLASRYHLALATAYFNPADATLCPTAGACTTCPKRTGNEPELFADVEAKDTCTDPDCFGRKRTLAVAQTIAQARSKGQRVIEGEEAAGLCNKYTGYLQGHTPINDHACQDPDGIEYTYADLLLKQGKKAPKPALFINPHKPDSLPTEAITDAEADMLLARYATKPGTPPKNETPAAARQRQQQADQAAAHLQRQVDKQTEEELIAAIATKVDQPRTHQDLILMVVAMCAQDFDDAIAAACGVGLEAVDDMQDAADCEGACIDAMQAMTGPQLAATAMRVALYTQQQYIASNTALHLAARSHGIDPDTIRLQVEARLAKQANDAAGAADADPDGDSGETTLVNVRAGCALHG